MKIICKILFFISLVCVMSGCSKLSVPDDIMEMQPGNVYFKIDGSASMNDLLRTKATGEIQTSEEKQVSNLFAVVFEDAIATGTTEVSTDIFHKCVEIDLTNVTTNLVNLSFTLGSEGDFLVTFVANANPALQGKIKALTSASTVQNLKDIIVESPDPSTKPDNGNLNDQPGMLMTSAFYKFTASYDLPTNLHTIYLNRVMSRIDIINEAPGVTVSEVKFYNRTVKTYLYNDGTKLLSGNIETSSPKTYTIPNGGLVGNKENPTEYKEEIYSYEQYYDLVSGSSPYLDITFKRDGDLSPSSHRVLLQDQNGTPIGLKRNNLYRIHLRNDAGLIEYEITVDDWNKYDDIAVSDDDIINGALGDPVDGEVNGPEWGDGGDGDDVETDPLPYPEWEEGGSENIPSEPVV